MSNFPSINFPVASILLMTLCLGVSVYFYVTGLIKKKEEQWDRRLKNLSAPIISHEGLQKKSARFSRRKAHNSDRFLRSATAKKGETEKIENYKAFLNRTGFDAEKWRYYYFAGKGVAACISALVFIVINQFQLLPDFTAFERVCLCIGIVVGGSFVPEIVITKFIRKYQASLERAAPDVVDFLLLSIEAGMTFDVALMETKKNLSLYAKDVARELEQLSAELMVLPDRTDAFDNLVHRTGSDTFRYLSTALSQGEKYGMPIVASLRIVAQESRKKTLIDLEQRAGKLPVLLSIPLMLLILPPVIVVSAGPGFVILMRSFGGN